MFREIYCRKCGVHIYNVYEDGTWKATIQSSDKEKAGKCKRCKGRNKIAYHLTSSDREYLVLNAFESKNIYKGAY